MEERAPLKPLLERGDFKTIGESYLRLSAFLSDIPLPTAVSGFPREHSNGRIRHLPAAHGRPLSYMEILLTLRDKELRGVTRKISRENVALASGLGGMALQELYVRSEDIILPYVLVKGVAAATGGIQRNIENALDGAIESYFVRDLVQELGGLIYSRRNGTPDQKRQREGQPEYLKPQK